MINGKWSIANYITNKFLLLSFLLVLSTVFVVDKELANGVVSGKYFWLYACMGLTGIATLISSICGKKSFRFSLLDFLIIGFTVSVLISTLFINSISGTGTKLILLVLLFVLYFSFRLIPTNDTTKKQSIVKTTLFTSCICLFIVITALVEAIWGLRQLYGFSASQHSLFKLTGSFFNPGPYAGYLSAVFPLALYYALSGLKQRENKKKNDIRKIVTIYLPAIIGVITCIAVLLVLPASMSRASWLASLSGSLIVLCGYYVDSFNQLKNFYHHHRKRIKFGIAALGIFCLTGITGMYLLKKDSADGRLLMWKISAKMITAHPSGVGLGNFSGAYGDAQAAYFASGKATPAEEYVAGNPEYAFNEYLQILAESGIISFLLFLLICFFALRNSFKLKNKGISGGLIALFVFAFFSYPFSVLSFLILLTFYLAMCNEQNAMVEKKGKPIRTVFIAAVLFILVACCLYKQYPAYCAYKKWNAERIYFHAELYGDAAKGYEKLYPVLNDQIQFLFEYAQSLSKSEQYVKSNEVLKRAVQISCDPMLYNIMGKNYQALKEYKEAEACFLKSTRMVPNRLYPWYLLTILYSEMGLDDKACETARIVETKKPKVHSPAVDEMRKEVQKMLRDR